MAKSAGDARHLDRDMIRMLALQRDIRGRRHAGERAELVHEMRLIVETAICRDARPLDAGAPVDARDDGAEALHAAVALRTHADMRAEHVAETTRRIAGVGDEIADACD